MTVVHIISFVLIILMAGYLLGEDPADILPFVWCALILVLYGLAYCRALNLIDVIAPVTAAGLTILAVKSYNKRPGTAVLRDISASLVAYTLLCILLPIALAPKIVTWWDDINFWATDLKSLYRLGGFAAKYANVSPEFGDYPPAVQLAKWYTVHFDRSVFREDLAFVGYYLFNLSFLMPLFKNIRGKRSWLGIPLAAVCWCFAGIAEIYGYSGFCADLSMAFIFGMVMIDALRTDCGFRAYSIIRPSVYLAVLVICKSTGFIWAMFGLVLWLGIKLCLDKNGKRAGYLPVCAGPLVTGISWILFCLLRHRVARTTATAVTYMTTDKYGLSPYRSEFASAFVRAFFTEPLHLDHTWIDLPPFFMLAFIILMLILLKRGGYIPGKAGTFVAAVLPAMGVLYYVMIFIAHLTIFATETQYLEPSGMAASIERYGAPFMLGCLMLIGFLWLSRDNRPFRLRIFVIAVIALTDLPAAFNGIIGFRSGLEEAEELRTSFIDKASDRFSEELSDSNSIAYDIKNGGTRVARVRDGAYYRVSDSYVAYEVSPVSVISPSFKLKDADADFFTHTVADTHAKYLYLDSQPEVPGYLDEMAGPDGFDFCRLYSIVYDDGCMKLYPAD